MVNLQEFFADDEIQELLLRYIREIHEEPKPGKKNDDQSD
jgi:hypothetical protein